MAFQQFLLRWRDALGNPRDLQITDGSDGGYRLSVLDKGEVLPHFGEALAVNNGDTAANYSALAATDMFIKGFYVWGETDALFELVINGTYTFKKQIHYLQREDYIWFPTPIYVSAGQNYLLNVTNNGQNLKDFQGAIFELK